MSKMQGTQRIAGAGALVVVAATLLACSEDSARPGGGEPVVMAHAPSSAPVAAPVVTDTPSSAAAEAESAPGNVTYGDAETVYRKGRYADAAELFGAYVSGHPQSVSGQYMLGLSAWKSGDRGRAEQALLRAVELDGTNVKVRTNLSRVLVEEGRAADALPHMEKAVELAPAAHEVWRVLGNVKSELGRGEEAIAAYRHALIRNDQDAWSMNNYGLVLIQQGRYDEAVPPLARAVELTPRSPVFLNNLGVALERSGEPGVALSVFAAAVEADSTYTKAKISMDRVRARLGDATITEPDLSTFAASFIEEMQRWRTARPEHDGC
jgi:Tfp pilus assembly protein PilF